VLLAGTVLITYLAARISILLPRTAIDKRPSLEWVWSVTAGNGWRLFIIVGLLPVLISTIPMVFYLFGKNILTEVPGALFDPLVLAVEITALSLSYQFLVQDH